MATARSIVRPPQPAPRRIACAASGVAPSWTIAMKARVIAAGFGMLDDVAPVDDAARALPA